MSSSAPLPVATANNIDYFKSVGDEENQCPDFEKQEKERKAETPRAQVGYKDHVCGITQK